MTILLITREPGRVICYSDSRVTHRPNDQTRTVTDHFSKLLVLPYHATIGKAADPGTKHVRGEFGYAFAGDILFATALYSMASNVFSNLHDEDADVPPDFEAFVDSLTRLANILLDDVIFNAKDRKYTVLFFGPCPATKEIKIYEIRIDECSTPWRFSYTEVEINDTGFKILGSGAQSFLTHVKMHPEKAASTPYAEILLDTIDAGDDVTIGGCLQQCIATEGGVQITPIIHPINEGEKLDIHVSGISAIEFGKVGQFGVGRDAVGFRVLKVMQTQWLLGNGFSKDPSENPSHVNETAKVMANLQHWQSSEGKSAGIHSYVSFVSPKEIDPKKHYFLGRCTKCNRPCPILEDPSAGRKPEPFFGKGGIIGTCCYCGDEVRAPVSKLKSKAGRP